MEDVENKGKTDCNLNENKPNANEPIKRDLSAENIRTKRGKASLRGRFAREMVKLMFNMNPVSCKNQIGTMNQLNILPFKLDYPGFKKTKFTLGGCDFYFYSKNNGNHKNCIYVLHGGAYVLPLCWIYTRLTNKLSRAGHGADVLYVDYHVAPDAKFPSMLDEAMTGWQWLMDKGYNPQNVVTWGDSAGAHLEMCLNFKLKENSAALPKAMVALSPWIDMTASSNSYVQNSKVDVMFGTKENITEEMIEQLLGSDIFTFAHQLDRKNKYVSPLFGDVTSFPDTLIISGGDEMLIGDALSLVKKLDEAGVENTHIIYDGMFHIFPTVAPLMKEASMAVKDFCSFISQELD